MRSLNARYPGRDFLKDWKTEARTFKFKPAAPTTDMTLLLKCCNCFDYQACETDDYNETKAAAFISKVRTYAMVSGAKSTDSPEYDNAAWGL